MVFKVDKKLEERTGWNKETINIRVYCFILGIKSHDCCQRLEPLILPLLMHISSCNPNREPPYILDHILFDHTSSTSLVPSIHTSRRTFFVEAQNQAAVPPELHCMIKEVLKRELRALPAMGGVGRVSGGEVHLRRGRSHWSGSMGSGIRF